MKYKLEFSQEPSIDRHSSQICYKAAKRDGIFVAFYILNVYIYVKGEILDFPK